MDARVVSLAFYLILLIKGSVQEVMDWKCTDAFCQNVLCPKLPKDCRNRSIALLIPSVGPCNCCDHCFLFQTEGEDCQRTTTELSLPNFMCSKGLTCNASGKCEKMESEDPYFFKNYVCEGERCYCAVLLADGTIKRIFGEFDSSTLNDDKMQCECSVVAYKAMTQPLRALPFKDVYQPSARCLKNGQFDPLQCIDDRCGCVEIETGIPDGNGFVYSLKALETNNPSCFNESRHIKGYYTPCEKKRNRLVRDINEEFWSNKNFIHVQKISCNPDGTYRH